MRREKNRREEIFHFRNPTGEGVVLSLMKREYCFEDQHSNEKYSVNSWGIISRKTMLSNFWVAKLFFGLCQKLFEKLCLI